MSKDARASQRNGLVGPKKEVLKGFALSLLKQGRAVSRKSKFHFYKQLNFLSIPYGEVHEH